MKQAGRLQEVLVIRSPPQCGGRAAATCKTGTNDTRQSPDFCTKRLRGGCWHANRQNMVLWLPCQHVGEKNTVCILPVSSTHDGVRWAGLAQSTAPFIKTALLQMLQCSPGIGGVVNLCQILDLMMQTARLLFLRVRTNVLLYGSRTAMTHSQQLMWRRVTSEVTNRPLQSQHTAFSYRGRIAAVCADVTQCWNSVAINRHVNCIPDRKETPCSDPTTSRFHYVYSRLVCDI